MTNFCFPHNFVKKEFHCGLDGDSLSCEEKVSDLLEAPSFIYSLIFYTDNGKLCKFHESNMLANTSCWCIFHYFYYNISQLSILFFNHKSCYICFNKLFSLVSIVNEIRLIIYKIKILEALEHILLNDIGVTFAWVEKVV